MSELVLKSISKTYRNGFTALRDVNLHLADGVFALLGPNGAGKSTLMQIIAGLLKPSSGDVSIDGLTPRADLESYRIAVGYLPQSFGFPPGSTVRSVLEHLGRLRGLENRARLAEEIERCLSSVNLLSRINARVSTLSGGMKQRLGIAQALVHSPLVLVLDEPTAGLDPEERNNFLLLLSEYATDHAIVLSTHLIDDVEAICQEMAFIAEGTVLSSGNRDEVLTPLEGRVYSLPPDSGERGRKLYDTVERGKPVGRYFVESGSRDAGSAETPTVRDAYALAIPQAARR